MAQLGRLGPGTQRNAGRIGQRNPLARGQQVFAGEDQGIAEHALLPLRHDCPQCGDRVPAMAAGVAALGPRDLVEGPMGDEPLVDRRRGRMVLRTLRVRFRFIVGRGFRFAGRDGAHGGQKDPSAQAPSQSCCSATHRDVLRRVWWLVLPMIPSGRCRRKKRSPPQAPDLPARVRHRGRPPFGAPQVLAVLRSRKPI